MIDPTRDPIISEPVDTSLDAPTESPPLEAPATLDPFVSSTPPPTPTVGAGGIVLPEPPRPFVDPPVEVTPTPRPFASSEPTPEATTEPPADTSTAEPTAEPAPEAVAAPPVGPGVLDVMAQHNDYPMTHEDYFRRAETDGYTASRTLGQQGWYYYSDYDGREVVVGPFPVGA